MTSVDRRRRTALILGDATIDWYLTMTETASDQNLSMAARWAAKAYPTLTAQAGGSALVRELVAEAVSFDPAVDVAIAGVEVPEIALSDPNHPDYVRMFSGWKLFPRTLGSKDLVWRMSTFNGLHPAVSAIYPVGELDVTDGLDCVFFEDGNQLFRDTPAAWEDAIERGAKQVVVRQTGGLGQGLLWKRVLEKWADRTTLICAVGDLRREGAAVGKSLSWERIAQDIVQTVKSHPSVSAAHRVIVLLSTSGAVIVHHDSPSVLVFDPFNQEGDWERNRPGIGFGAGSCSVAAIVDEAACYPETPDFARATKRGVAAARSLIDSGYDAESENGGWRLSFPVSRIAPIIGGIDEADSSLQIAEIQDQVGWRLFETAFTGSFREAAAQIALHGERAAGKEIPIERMGAWSSVDRIEIESMRSLRNIIAEYLASPRKGRPLNVAVFGPPGSGKSFAIKQMAKEGLSSSTRMDILEFNLSQFGNASELPAALQRVRDQTVQESLPLVFWDEFDSALEGRELGWLVNFLAPMQDGAFMEDGVARPIGPAIFVFAGGTHSTMDSFRNRAFELPSAKATDFLSRLRGYVNILGPNPDENDDLTYTLRRAMLLRAVLSRHAPQVFADSEMQIDPGILAAFLDAPKYFHGSRSIEAIVEMSALSTGNRYERSTLPAVHQLDLHVDAEEFMRLVEQGKA